MTASWPKMIFCVSPRMCAATWLTYRSCDLMADFPFYDLKIPLGRAQLYRKTPPAGNRRDRSADGRYLIIHAYFLRHARAMAGFPLLKYNCATTFESEIRDLCYA